MGFSSDEINYLVYRYLRESGFLHSSYTFRYESQLNLREEAYNVEPGRLIRLLQRGILYLEAEKKIEKSIQHLEAVNDNQVSFGDLKEIKSVTKSSYPKTTSHSESLTKQNNLEDSEKKVSKDSVRNPIARKEKQLVQNDKGIAIEEALSKRANTNSSFNTEENEDEQYMSIDIINNENESEKNIDQPIEKDDNAGKQDELPLVSGNVNDDSDTMDIDLVGIDNSKLTLKRSEIDQLNPKDQIRKKKPKTFGQITNLKGHNSSAFVSAWNPAIPNVLASGAGDGTARIWNLSSSDTKSKYVTTDIDNKPIILRHSTELSTSEIENTELNGEENVDITTLAWNTSGTMLATGCFDGHARIWTVKGELLKSFEDQGAPIISLKWSPSSNYLLTGSLDGVAILWDVEKSSIVSRFEAHSGGILDVAWCNDSIFATCSSDRTILVWSIYDSMKPVRRLVGHQGDINCIGWHSSGKYLASGSDDGTAKIYLFSPELLNELSNNEKFIEKVEVDEKINEENNIVGEKGKVGGVKEETPYYNLEGHEQQVYVVEWLPGTENAVLATGSFDGSVRVWDVGNGGDLIRTLRAHNDPIHSIAFSHDGRHLITGSFDCFVNLWNLRNGLLLRSFMADDGIYDVDFSSAGRIAACVANGSVVILDSKA
ncbi:hypothetical protein BB558_005368 [Smittium angustum]|uniref:LisH domain-containing protein n=1 Tax=Smittium angustum TaxID=133377 RepID=A0A2U1J0P8_SMIAN|nr:hypothetical protein BB558_005368 [Smittium angustum]